MLPYMLNSSLLIADEKQERASALMARCAKQPTKSTVRFQLTGMIRTLEMLVRNNRWPRGRLNFLNRDNIMKLKTALLLSATIGGWISISSVQAAELEVLKSYAACKIPSTVEKFEDFERRDDDQGYKRLYLQTGASGECIFLRSGELLEGHDTKHRWDGVKPNVNSSCFWTAAAAVTRR